MQHLGTSYGVLQKEKCTGDPARRLGNDLVFQQLAEANLEALKKNQVKKIVSICPHCVRTIAKDWAEYGPAPEIEHHSEFLARHKEKLPQAGGESITFHDPCYLGRYAGTVDEPRALVAKLNQDLVRVIKSRELTARITDVGAYVVADTPEEFAAFMRDEIAKFSKVIRDAKITQQ